jgi:hypothetical protein
MVNSPIIWQSVLELLTRFLSSLSTKIQQLRKNWDDEPQKMRWFAEMEKEMQRQWKKEMSYSSAKKIGLQQDFFFGTGSGCQAGFCTD